MTGRNFTPGSSASVVLHSVETNLGTVKVDGNGAFFATVTIPAATAPGQHQLVVTDANGKQATASLTVQALGVSTTLPVTGAPIGREVAGGLLFLGGGMGLVALANLERRRSAVRR